MKIPNYADAVASQNLDPPVRILIQLTLFSYATHARKSKQPDL